MSDVVKTGTIKIDIVRGKSDVKAPDIAPIIEAKEKEIDLGKKVVDQQAKIREAAAWAAAAQQAAALKVIRAQQEMANSAQGLAQAQKQAADQAAAAQQAADEKAIASSLQRMQAMSQMVEGLLKVGRAAMLVGTQGGADLQQLVTALVAAQVAVDLFTGASAALQGFVAWLGAAKLATLGLAGAVAILESLLLPVIIVIAALAAAWMIVAGNAEKARQEQEKATAAANARTEATIAAIDKAIAKEVELSAKMRETMSLQEQAAAIKAIDPAGNLAYAREFSDQGTGSSRTQQQMIAISEANLALLDEQKAVAKAILEQDLEKLSYAEELIQAKQKELDLANDVLKAEEAKTQAFAAQFGALSKGEQERLKRIDRKISGGEDLSKGELRALGQAGGLAAEAAARIYAEKGRAAGSDGLLFGGKDTVADAARRASNAAGEIQAITGGQSSDAALQAIKSQKAELEKNFALLIKGTNELIRKGLADQSVMNQRLKKLELAQASVKGR